MNIQIKIIEKQEQTALIITAPEMNESVVALKKQLEDALNTRKTLELYENGAKFYVEMAEILFFETADGKTFAHSCNKIYETKLRLYELDEMLPESFIRAGKSVIIDTGKILSVQRNLAGPSLAQFKNSRKQVYVSRGYFREFAKKLSKRSK